MLKIIYERKRPSKLEIQGKFIIRTESREDEQEKDERKEENWRGKGDTKQLSSSSYWSAALMSDSLLCIRPQRESISLWHSEPNREI